MNAQQLQPSQPIVRRNNTRRVWWAGLGLAIAAAAAIFFAIRAAPAQAPLDQPVEVHLITAVNAQSVRAHPNLPPTRRSSRVPTAPGAVSRVNYVPAHSTSLSGRPSSAPRSRTTAVINNHLYVPCSVSSCDPMPAVINNHLYVPCSVSSCDPMPAVINNHLYVPCSVSSCDPMPAVINNHLYVPCSVSMCNATPGTPEQPLPGGTQ
jgi:hypothetical protein